MVHIHDAIRALNSAITTVRGDVAYDQNEKVIAYDKAAAQTKLVELEAQESQSKQATTDAKNSALAKLTALGLTSDEIKALIG